MADPLCRVMDAQGVVDPNVTNGSIATKKAVAKVCLDPATLEVNSAAVVRLSPDEIRRIESDFQARTNRGRRLNDPILPDETIKALERAAKNASSNRLAPKPSDKKK